MRNHLIDTARELRSVDGENPEYDRALVELSAGLLRLPIGSSRETLADAILQDGPVNLPDAWQPLTLADLELLGQIASAAQRNAHVRWLPRVPAGLQDGRTVEGVARAITHDGGGFLGPNDDIRDGFLWVSGIFERWLSVREVVAMLRSGTFAID